MEAYALRTLFPVSCASHSRRFIGKWESKMSTAKNLFAGFDSKIFYEVSTRRLLIEFMGIGASALYVNPVFSMPTQEAKDTEIIRYLKLSDGVKVQDVVEGEGLEAHEGDVVELNYVCRRSNGYFVHSTVDQFSGESRPVILPLDGKEIILGLQEVLIGMKVGGKRRALIPPNVGYVSENLKPIPDEGPSLFEDISVAISSFYGKISRHDARIPKMISRLFLKALCHGDPEAQLLFKAKLQSLDDGVVAINLLPINFWMMM